MIKGLRRSLKGEKRTSGGAPSPSGAPPPPGQGKFAAAPPKKIIKALYDYNSQGPGELGFSKGDFLYVVGHEADDEWYDAYDPPSNLRGMVPVAYFEVVSRNDAIHTVPLANLNGPPVSPTDASAPAPQHRLSQGKPQSPLYGIVLYDFVAERPDELQASAGESIIVIAQSNEEWFVAKPIGRLGGPGLIPVSFVQIRDLASDKPVENIEAAIRRAGVPKVEEWKRMAAEYKASSIPLGRFDDEQVTQQMRGLNMNAPPQNPGAAAAAAAGRAASSHSGSARNSLGQGAPGPYVVSASVDRYAFDGGRYWYLVVAELSNGKFRNLCRYYQDFYDFQIKLLDEFPEEAGRTGKQRSLPFMPGPLTYVNDSISSQRRANLDDYVRNLINMPPYISRSMIVQQLFALRTGDIETPYLTNTMPQPPERDENYQPQPQQPQQVQQPQQPQPPPQQQQPQQQPQYAQPQLAGHSHSSSTDSSKQQQQQLQHSRAPSESQRSSLHSHVRASSQATVTDNFSSRAESPQQAHHQHSQSSHQHSQSSASQTMPPPEGPVVPVAPSASPEEQNANGYASNPSEAHSNPPKDQFIKVKVFHADDLIAIRVPSSITFDGLVSRICERLSLETVALLHKDDATGELDQMTNDEEFAQTLGDKTKLVLYAR